MLSLGTKLELDLNNIMSVLFHLLLSISTFSCQPSFAVLTISSKNILDVLHILFSLSSNMEVVHQRLYVVRFLQAVFCDVHLINCKIILQTQSRDCSNLFLCYICYLHDDDTSWKFLHFCCLVNRCRL